MITTADLLAGLAATATKDDGAYLAAACHTEGADR